MTLHDSPDFDAARAAHSERHGLSIAYIKKRVGPGAEYENEVARAVLSDHGGYFELAEMPEEFAGALGAGVSHRLIRPTEASALMAQVQALAEGILAGTQPVHSASLYALYAGGSLRSRRGMFVLDQKPGEPPFAHGRWQPEALPRFFKLRLDCGAAPPPAALGLSPHFPPQGVSFFLAPHNRDDGHALLATLARTPNAQDLSAAKTPTLMH